jgi:hypothetical protein
VAPCSRCGTFLCGDCTEVMDEAAWCADCVEWLRRNGPTSRLVKVLIAAGILGIVSFPLCFMPLTPVLQLFVGATGVMVTRRELRRIREGEGPLRGLPQAKVARGLAVANLLLLALWGVIVLYALYGQRIPGWGWGVKQ